MAGGFKYNVNRSKTDGPKSSGGGGLSQLMTLMAAQQKSQGTQENMGEGAIPTGGTDAYGVRYKTEDSRVFTADAQNQLTRIKQLKNALNSYRELADTLPSGIFKDGDISVQGFMGGGFAEGLKSDLTRGNFGTGEIKTYKDSRPAIAAGIYRAITGDNRLSDQDAEARSLPLLWDPSEGPDTRSSKFAFIDYLMNEAERNVSPGEPASDIESLSRFQSVINSAKQRYQEQTPPTSTIQNTGVQGVQSEDIMARREAIKARFKARNP